MKAIQAIKLLEAGMVNDYSQWDIINDDAHWITMKCKCSFKNRAMKNRMLSVKGGDNKYKLLCITGVVGEDFDFPFYKLDISKIEGVTFLTFTNTLTKEELEVQVGKFL